MSEFPSSHSEVARRRVAPGGWLRRAPATTRGHSRYPRRDGMRRCRGLWIVFAVLVATGCSRVDTSAAGETSGFVTAQRSVLVIPEDERGEPVTGLAGPTVDGGDYDLADQASGETVVNVWGSWCPPCRAEAPDLVRASERLADDGVSFLGIDVKDTPAQARAFQRRFGITWPSLDDPDGQFVLAMRAVPSAAIPTTWVLDDEGRIAARIVDQVDADTLVDLVADVRAGDVSTETVLDG